LGGSGGLGKQRLRLLGFWDEGRLIILTNAFAKKTQKTPPREISLAEQRRTDYLSRKKSHERRSGKIH
jgi:phage-related protein